MNPELLSLLAAEHRRDLAAARPAVPGGAVPSGRPVPADRTVRRARPTLLPRFRVSWTRTTLAAVSGRRRGRSLIIVMSATRTF